MIYADFHKENDELRLVIKGHANYRDDGHDEVCASVSAIFYMLVGYMKNRFSRGNITVNRIEPGYADISCTKEGLEPMRMACIGILQVSESYPGCVRVKNRIWN